MQSTIFRTVAIGVVGCVLLAAPSALAAKAPKAPAGGYTGSSTQDRPFHLHVKNGRISFIYADVVIHCADGSTSGSSLAGTSSLLGSQAKLQRTGSGRYRFVIDQPQGVAITVNGTFSRNGKRVAGTVSVISPNEVPVSSPVDPTPTGPPIVCGSTKAADGTITNPPVHFTARL